MEFKNKITNIDKNMNKFNLRQIFVKKEKIYLFYSPLTNSK
jgi:hypothetical protein